MNDTAHSPTSNVDDIWSVPDPASTPVDDHVQVASQPPSIPSFGRPGFNQTGEIGGNVEQATVAHETLPSSNEVYKAPEVLPVPEIGEKLPLTELYSLSKEVPQELKSPVLQDALPQNKVLDKRTGKVRTHRVADTADKTTKTADIKEQEFIKGVEEIHTIV